VNQQHRWPRFYLGGEGGIEVRTNNPLERIQRDIRRRTRLASTHFPIVKQPSTSPARACDNKTIFEPESPNDRRMSGAVTALAGAERRSTQMCLFDRAPAAHFVPK
jgi:hypothetical protein